MLFYEPMEEDISDATHPTTSTEHGIDGAVVEAVVEAKDERDEEGEEEEEDGLCEEGISLDEVASPARRIRALMAMVRGEGELG